MNHDNDKIKFLARFEELDNILSGLLSLFVSEQIITQDEALTINSKPASQKMQSVHLLLKTSDKFMMVDWEWVVLPEERLKLIVVTHNSVKEFTYSV